MGRLGSAASSAPSAPTAPRPWRPFAPTAAASSSPGHAAWRPRVREETQPRREALASVTTPPGWVYTDPDWYARERELVFFTRWAAVAREEQVAEPGSLHLVDLAGES